MNNIEKIRLKLSLMIPVFLLLIMWAIKLYEYSFGISFSDHGIFPRRLFGLPGILLSPFIHENFNHLYSNSLPFLILGSSLFYFYKDSALKVFVLIWILSGSWVWIFGRTAYHIGASGVIYGFASFIFFSGVLNKSKPLLSVSLLVVFIYGSMVWGVLPIKPEVSWESHLLGAITGFVLALIYSPDGTQRQIEEEEEDFCFPVFIKSDKFCDLD